MGPPGELYAVKAAWCICSVKSCVIHAERFRSGVIHLRRYTNEIPLPLPLQWILWIIIIIIIIITPGIFTTRGKIKKKIIIIIWQFISRRNMSESLQERINCHVLLPCTQYNYVRPTVWLPVQKVNTRPIGSDIMLLCGSLSIRSMRPTLCASDSPAKTHDAI